MLFSLFGIKGPKNRNGKESFRIPEIVQPYQGIGSFKKVIYDTLNEIGRAFVRMLKKNIFGLFSRLQPFSFYVQSISNFFLNRLQILLVTF